MATTAAAAAAAESPLATSRVIKTLAPGRPGTLRWTRQHGIQLVCVRYRVDAAQRTRYTTVELVVASAPMLHREHPATWVHVAFKGHERDLQGRAVALGAVWDDAAGLWRLPLAVARKLGLRHRVQTPKPPKGRRPGPR